jgi:hypothetical protein
MVMATTTRTSLMNIKAGDLDWVERRLLLFLLIWDVIEIGIKVISHLPRPMVD